MKKHALGIALLILAAPFGMVAQSGTGALPVPPGADSTGPRLPKIEGETDITNGSPTAKTPVKVPDASISPATPAPGGRASPEPGPSSGANSVNAAAATARPGSDELATMDATSLTEVIRQCPRDQRTAVLRSLSARLTAGAGELSIVRDVSTGMTGVARTNFESALNDVKSREKALKKTLAKATNAAPARWAEVRSSLADQFEAYTVALTRAQSISAINPVSR